MTSASLDFSSRNLVPASSVAPTSRVHATDRIVKMDFMVSDYWSSPIKRKIWIVMRYGERLFGGKREIIVP